MPNINQFGSGETLHNNPSIYDGFIQLTFSSSLDLRSVANAILSDISSRKAFVGKLTNANSTHLGSGSTMSPTSKSSPIILHTEVFLKNQSNVNANGYVESQIINININSNVPFPEVCVRYVRGANPSLYTLTAENLIIVSAPSVTIDFGITSPATISSTSSLSASSIMWSFKDATIKFTDPINSLPLYTKVDMYISYLSTGLPMMSLIFNGPFMYLAPTSSELSGTFLLPRQFRWNFGTDSFSGASSIQFTSSLPKSMPLSSTRYLQTSGIYLPYAVFYSGETVSNLMQ